jgi:hypothetical protein
LATPKQPSTVPAAAVATAAPSTTSQYRGPVVGVANAYGGAAGGRATMGEEAALAGGLIKSPSVSAGVVTEPSYSPEDDGGQSRHVLRGYGRRGRGGARRGDEHSLVDRTMIMDDDDGGGETGIGDMSYRDRVGADDDYDEDEYDDRPPRHDYHRGNGPPLVALAHHQRGGSGGHSSGGRDQVGGGPGRLRSSGSGVALLMESLRDKQRSGSDSNGTNGPPVMADISLVRSGSGSSSPRSVSSATNPSISSVSVSSSGQAALPMTNIGLGFVDIIDRKTDNISPPPTATTTTTTTTGGPTISIRHGNGSPVSPRSGTASGTSSPNARLGGGASPGGWLPASPSGDFKPIDLAEDILGLRAARDEIARQLGMLLAHRDDLSAKLQTAQDKLKEHMRALNSKQLDKKTDVKNKAASPSSPNNGAAIATATGNPLSIGYEPPNVVLAVGNNNSANVQQGSTSGAPTTGGFSSADLLRPRKQRAPIS